MEELPEPILHRILSFLTGKEAVRTTLLSKSWRSAWLTRRHLDFDERDYSTYKFLDVVTKCMKRYVKFNLTIDSFGLRMKCTQEHFALAAKQFIVTAMEIGATRLSIRLYWGGGFVLPNEVFASENLVELSVKDCRIRDDYPSVRCTRLKVLSLGHVSRKSYNAIAHILSHCPSIEKLVVLGTGKVGDSGPTDAFPKMQNLRSLVISKGKFDTLFLGDVSSSMLPALKDLTLDYTRESGEDNDHIRISNHSLEQLHLIVGDHSMKVEFDVPSMRKFTYQGKSVEMSSLSFKSTVREWESRVSIYCPSLGMPWFRGLNKFLTGLSMSTMYLYLDVYNRSSFDYDVEDIQGLPKPRVENLIMTMTSVPSLSCYALFDGLFQICRPNSITQYLVPEPSDGNWKTNNHFLCKALVQNMCDRQKRTIQCFDLGSLDDLKEVSLHILDVVDGKWHEIVPLEALLDGLSPTKKQKIQFRMRWR